MNDKIENKEPASQFLKTDRGKTKSNAVETPSIALPKGGGAIKGIDEKFSVNAVNGTASFSIPLPFSPARGASPSLNLSYNSGAGNGVFGLGWSLGLSSIKRKTDKKLPQYFDSIDSDTFLFSEAEDLVPELIVNTTGNYISHETDSTDGLFTIRFYKPRIEGLFARIERWTEKANGVMKWRVISKENVTTLFGWSAASRISDPRDPGKIFEWLPEFVFDDKGNCSHYIYKKEDNVGCDPLLLHHRNRFANGDITYTNLYLEKILYGNKTPYTTFNSPLPPESDYFFQTVFDYGEYNINAPYDKINNWRFRKDAFSEYKAGFEIRTTRLCQRVLLFHYFAELPGGSALVKSMDFDYDTAKEEGFTFLKAITVRGYIKQDDGTFTYTMKNLPPLQFDYQNHDWNCEVKSISPEDLAQAPVGLDESQYQFTDLFNEGLAGILTEQGDGWYYKHNLGSGKFEPAKLVSPKPSFTGLGSRLQLLDLDGDGGKQLVNFNTEPKGYFELNDDNQWETFRTFKNLPNIDMRDPNTRLLDVNGDGKPEVVITEDHVFTWYESAGREGFESFQQTPKPFDEEAGPHIVFSDPTQTIFLADMSGDGLTDIVRIRNGEVCYWPNLGYGKFGAKVGMDHAPVFDHPGSFNPAYLRLADIDGSGTTDIIYLGKNKFSCWMNLSGNAFSAIPFEIDNFPEIHNLAKISVTDLLGNGIACIVWSSGLSKDAQAPLKYIDLMKGKKPHIMIAYKNNLGKEVSLEYTPSTQFYIDDKLAGRPWVTRLHFPVHCISRTETRDMITGTRFISSYAYHHGYYDHAEREFRGFGMVEQMDAEHFDHWVKGNASNIVDKTLHQEPVLTRSWFHTGAFLSKDKILNQFAHEYWYEEMKRQGFDVENNEVPLPDAKIIAAPGLDAAIIAELSPQEWREALRACKGMALRTEVFAKSEVLGGVGTLFQKGSDLPGAELMPDQLKKELTPFTVATHNCVIELLQPRGHNAHAVFVVKESEAITYNYERNTQDPRIAHNLNIKLDEYGNVLESAAVVYPRRVVPSDMPEQGKLHIVYTENDFINKTDDNTRLIGVNYQTKVFEITGIGFSNNQKFEVSSLLNDINNATEIDFSAEPTTGIEKRKIQHDRIYFWDDGINQVMPLGQISLHALPYQKQSLEFTGKLIEIVNDGDQKITSDILLNEGKYIQEDDMWWIPSEIQYFNPSAFYLPLQIRDPFGNTTQINYDDYNLLIISIVDAMGKKTSTENDYRLLQPCLLTDPNNNRQAVGFDTMGMVKALAVMGKNGEGDTTLSNPTIIYEYDLHNWKDNGLPVYSHIKSRETHADPNTRWLESYTYTNGSGQEIQTKVQAEDGLAWIIEDGAAVPIETTNRWIATGRTILNNKGKVVKQYEPWFSTSYEYEPEKELTQYGVTPIMHYDPLGRNIRTDYPDGTFVKVEFTPWEKKQYDQNDTVLDSQWYQDNAAPNPNDPEPTDSRKRAAWLSAQHANTPQTHYLDTLGRVFIIEDDNGVDDQNNPRKYCVHNKLDSTGRPLTVTDAKGREMTHNIYGLKQQLYIENIDSGRRWTLADVAGKPIRSWDNRGHAFRNTYDVLQRPVGKYVKNGNTEILTEKYGYGTDSNENNIGQLEFIYDQSGITHIEQYDFKGNPLCGIKQYCEDYKNDIDWNQNPTLQSETFTQLTEYDAFNRPVKLTQPDGSQIVYVYNKAALLDAVYLDGNIYVKNINYNEKGQRTKIYFGNQSRTKYTYDTQTFRLTNLKTTRPDGNGGHDVLQNLCYTYDAVGNIVEQTDIAQQRHYFNNTVIDPTGKYQYDALYRLIKAKGRELMALNMPDNNDFGNDIPVPSGNDVQNYTQLFTFDEIGNIQKIRSVSNYGWTRNYIYDTVTNRLFKHDAQQTLDDYDYDMHGNMICMPHLQEMQWDYADRLRKTTCGTVNTWYCYDTHGERVRKVTEKQGGRKEERIYLNGYEVFRKYISGNLDLERKSLNILDIKLPEKGEAEEQQEKQKKYSFDNNKKIAIIETETLHNTITIRYQYANHLGSACLELDEDAKIISYEEYHPYGSTSYRSGRGDVDVSLKRYKYVGKERDEETGLYYYGARYYAAWLCRFVSVDALQHKYPNYTPYQYAGNKPISYIDLDGLEEYAVIYWKADGKLVVTSIMKVPKDYQIPNFSKNPDNVYYRNVDIKCFEKDINFYQFDQETTTKIATKINPTNFNLKIKNENSPDWSINKGLKDRERAIKEGLKLNFNKLFQRLESGDVVTSFSEPNAGRIQFELNSADLTLDAKAELKNVYTYMLVFSKSKITLEAHTSSEGSYKNNQTLSEKRAESAKNYLISLGIDSTRINAIGFGESKLLTNVKPEDSANRRIEIKIDDKGY